MAFAKKELTALLESVILTKIIAAIRNYYLVSAITITHLNRTFPDSKRGDIVALENVSFEARAGEFICIIGPSGCGKSTLLQLIAGLDQPTSGKIRINGNPVTGPSAECGFVFQDYALFPWVTVQKNVEFGPKMKRFAKNLRAEIARKYIELTGLQGFEARYPNELSGGMKQRVAIARALANEPQILLMDEPFAAVDSMLRENLQQEILNIWNKTGKTVIFVTHQIDEAIYLADRIIVMTPRPGSILKTVNIDLPRPRERSLRISRMFQELQKEIRELVWQDSLPVMSDGFA